MSQRPDLAERNKTHGLSHLAAYRSWKEMRHRCLNKAGSDYQDYGGRGIAICEHWAEFPAFVADMGDRPKGMSLDRIDVNGNYEPANCRWADAKTQAANKRNSKPVVWRGESKPLAQWCREIGLETSKVRYRMKSGWPLDKCFSRIDGRS